MADRHHCRTGLSSTAEAIEAPWVLWGSTLSPFALKVEAMLRFSGVPYRWLPAEGRFREALRFARRRAKLVGGRLPLTRPPKHALDEFPLVPFVFGPRGENLYDSSAIGAWLDARRGGRGPRLLPVEDAALRFAVRLVDEALDEFGLCLAHHNRWVTAARDNDAGVRLAHEMRPLLGLLAPALGRFFPARQVRRLPYLFSVAPDEAGFSGLPARLRPPARAGFPPTHALLDDAYAHLVAALEPLLRVQPFLFGEGFTLADASVYGQLGMNRADPSAHARLGRLGPAVHAWVERIAQGEFRGHRPDGGLRLEGRHGPLLAWVAATFVPLMQQNLAAWESHRLRGETCFNERAQHGSRALRWRTAGPTVSRCRQDLPGTGLAGSHGRVERLAGVRTIAARCSTQRRHGYRASCLARGLDLTLQRGKRDPALAVHGALERLFHGQL